MASVFVQSFRGFEEKPYELDNAVNAWMTEHAGEIEVVDVKAVLGHVTGAHGLSGASLIYVVMYRAESPIPMA
jgi:hypothetical protein